MSDEEQPSEASDDGSVSTAVSIRDIHLVELHLRPVEDADRRAIEDNARSYTFHASVDDTGFTSMAIPHKDLVPPNSTHILALEDGIDVVYRQEVIIAETFLQIAVMFIVRTDPPVDYRTREDWATQLAEQIYEQAFPIMMSHASVAKGMMGRLTTIPRMKDSTIMFTTVDDLGGVYPGDVAAARSAGPDD